VAHRPEAFNGGRVAGESNIWRGAFIFFFSHGGSYKLAGFFLSVACEMLGRGAWRIHGTGLADTVNVACFLDWWKFYEEKGSSRMI
jgi:hypothetical protein